VLKRTVRVLMFIKRCDMQYAEQTQYAAKTQHDTKMQYAIRVDRLVKSFTTRLKEPGLLGSIKGLFYPKRKSISAVDSISFSIKPGELVGFIGPNGAGKSTTLKMLTGILWPTSGSIDVLGHNPQKERVKLAYKIGSIFGQRQQLWMHLPAIDSFELFGAIYDVPKDELKKRISALSAMFGIKELMHQPVRKLSLGERMRCEFVASLLHKPQVLFLDEPTIGMDILAKRAMREHVKQLNERENTTIILTSHDLGDIEELCKRVIVINHGMILFDGSIDELRSRLRCRVVRLVFDKPVRQLPKLKGVRLVKSEPLQVTLHVDRKIPASSVLEAYLKKLPVADVSIEDPPIEEVIEELYR